MTRDEIKNTPELVDFMLDESIIADSRMKLHKRLEELCKLAIKALEQEPTTKNDLGVDAISRADAERILTDLYHSDICDYCLLDILEDIKALPPVTPIRPKGHWIGHREHCENLGVMPSGLGAYEWCSNCDCGIDVGEWHRNNYNYCPNCGAKMIESQESEG